MAQWHAILTAAPAVGMPAVSVSMSVLVLNRVGVGGHGVALPLLQRNRWCRTPL